MNIRSVRAVVAAALLLGMGSAAFAAASPRDKPKAIDFTKGDRPNETHDWNLGATGLRGWMWGWRNHTTDARQILITRVDEKSPADGIIKVDDVILGVNGRAFTRSLASASGVCA